MSLTRVSYRIVISGRVQGVAFRVTMRDVAALHGVDGWVRNGQDGAVIGILQGEEVQVEKVVEWAKRGPPAANVTGLKKERLDDHPPQTGFRILG
jgi:acylphosphatase